MLEVDRSLERFFTDGNGQRVSEVHIYGPAKEIQELTHNPATTGTRIIPHRSLEEGGELMTSLPLLKK